jgi:tetratricopeptide (TPR) repeat protein
VVEPEKAAPSPQSAIGEKPALPAAAVETAKPQPAPEEKPLAPAKSQPAAAEKVAAPAEKPAPAAVPEVEKPRPVEKKAAAEKVAAPAEKPAQPEKPAPAVIPGAEKPRPVEKKVAAEKPALPEHPATPKPAPRPVVDKPAPEKVKTVVEPPAARPEKKPPEAAPPGAKPVPNKAQEATEAYQRGNAKLLSGALPEAIAAFSEALKLNPKDAQSQRGLGMAYAQAGNAAKAVRHLKLYLKASPNAPDRALIEKRIDQLGGR